MFRCLIGSLIVVVCATPAFAQALTISSAGTYTLSGDLASSGQQVIAISADNVTLNLNGHVVRCTPTNPATAVTVGIYAPSRSHVTIRGGTITGCMFGLHAGYGNHITLEDVALGGNTYIGAHLASGAGSNIVRRVTCLGIGGYGPEAYAICINGIGPNGLIEDLTAQNMYRQPTARPEQIGEGVGVLVEAAGATNVTIRRFTFTNAQQRLNTFGLWAAGTVDIRDSAITNAHTGIKGAGLTAVHNTLTLTDTSVSGAVGIESNSVSFSENTFTGYATPWLGSIADGGGNVVTGAELPPPPPPAPVDPPSVLATVCLPNGTCYQGIIPKVGG